MKMHRAIHTDCHKVLSERRSTAVFPDINQEAGEEGAESQMPTAVASWSVCTECMNESRQVRKLLKKAVAWKDTAVQHWFRYYDTPGSVST